MKIHHLSVEEALATLQTTSRGLPDAEAKRRLAEFGPNVIERIRDKPLAIRFLKSFTHFFAVILWIAAGLAFFAEAAQPRQGMATLGFAIVGVVLINGVFSFWQEYRAERAIRALEKLLPQQVMVRRNGAQTQIPAEELGPGDIICLSSGGKVPADCRVLTASGLRVNNSTITGEAMPHSRTADVSAEPELIHSGNVLLAGTTLVSGETTAVVFATGRHTAFGQIAHLTQMAREELSPLQREISRLSRWVALLAMSIGVVFFFVGHAMGLPFWANLIFAIGIIVANVPEGLMPTVTLALAMGAQRMAKRRALIRHLPAVETLGAATVICTDKTGTLTQNSMIVRRLVIGLEQVDVSDAAQLQAATAEGQRVFAVTRFCHTLQRSSGNGGTHWVGDPLEIALVNFAKRVEAASDVREKCDEIPFDSSRQMMSTLHEISRGWLLLVKGAPEAVLARCTRFEGRGKAEVLTDALRTRISSAVAAMGRDGLRVLALAYRTMSPGTDRLRWEEQLTIAGFVGLEDPPRPEVPEAIERCHEAGIKVIMVTGDHPQTALAIAREIGLVRSTGAVVLTGEQLRRLSNTQLQLALDAPEILFARVTADQKMRIVSALKRKRQVVAVTGDGVNDAPALRQADIGISMGISGTDVARESADMILLDDNFATIVAAIEEGRAVYANIRKFLTYILTSNVPELVPYLAFVLFRIPLPLTIIQILAVDLGTDMLPAIALGAEPARRQIMTQPPRRISDRLVTFSLIARAYLWLGAMQAVAAMSIFFFVLHRGGWSYGQRLHATDPLYLQATTACLSAIIVMQVVNVFLCRSRRESAFAFNITSNPLLLVGVVVEIALILLIVYSPWGNAIFGTAPLPVIAWLSAIPFGIAMLLLEEARKWIVRRSVGHSSAADLVFSAAHSRLKNRG
jgi:sodium/potassium-transporting ATPase subunit alpha